MNDEPQSDPSDSYENTFELPEDISLNVRRGTNIPTGTAYEMESFSRKGTGLFFVISKWGNKVSFFASIFRFEINYGALHSDGRPRIVLLSDHNVLIAAFWRKNEGLLCPIDQEDFERFESMLAEDDEPGEILDEIMSKIESQL